MLERSVRFVYEWRVTWLVLVHQFVDPEVAKIIGPDMPDIPPVLWSPAQFNQLLARWYRALSAHRLDGGYGHFHEESGRLCAEVIVVPRRIKCQS
jgi:hypothetical protein